MGTRKLSQNAICVAPGIALFNSKRLESEARTRVQQLRDARGKRLADAALELEAGACQSGGVSDAILRLKIVLADTEPSIWRRVEVPAEMTLKELHGVIQVTMGWNDDHLFQFYVGRDTIAGPGMGGGFGAPRSIGAGRVRLGDLLASRVKRFTYLYDIGDSWEHKIQIEKSLSADPAARYPRFIDGALRCPPEDIGGIPGFYAFLSR